MNIIGGIQAIFSALSRRMHRTDPLCEPAETIAAREALRKAGGFEAWELELLEPFGVTMATADGDYVMPADDEYLVYPSSGGTPVGVASPDGYVVY